MSAAKQKNNPKSIQQYTDQISSYRISQQDIVEFLRRIFGQGQFHVWRTGDTFMLSIPRKLSEKEKNDLYEFGLPRHHYSSPELDAKSSRNSPSDFVSEGPVVQRQLGTLDEEPSVPTIQGSTQGSFKLPLEGSLKDYNLAYSPSSLSLMYSSPRGVAKSFYGVNISKGETSKVFEVEARWSWEKRVISESSEPQSLKVAVKRLSRHTERTAFLQEYDALKAATRNPHRNIVEFLNAFRYEDEGKAAFYNFSFPLAPCNLKTLFNHRASHLSLSKCALHPHLTADPPDLLSSDFCAMARENLWTEFEGLASALAHLHEKCQISHSDIKPSNILLYGPYKDPPAIVAKLADFGLAVDLNTRLTWQLGSREARSAWQYDPPEIRNAFKDRGNPDSQTKITGVTHGLDAKQLMSGDVWKLGSVFVEMLTFLVDGHSSVHKFRKFITTTVEELTSDHLNDSRFDDGEKVKVEVLQWLSRLAAKDLRAQEIHNLLNSMLDKGLNRPSSRQVAGEMKTLSLCAYDDGARRIHFTASQFVRCPSHVDQCKLVIESQVGAPIDWWPLKAVNRSCPQGYMRISWHWSDRMLHVDVPEAQAQVYRKKCRAVSDMADTVLQPPQARPQGTTRVSMAGQRIPSSLNIDPTSSSNAYPLSSLPSGYQRQDGSNDVLHYHSGDESSRTRQISQDEIYWCVDKAWSEPRSIKLCSLMRKYPEIRDDESLYNLLVKEYNRVRTWKGRLLSWKSCLGIDFIKFVRTSTGRDKVIRLQTGLPPASPPIYKILRLLPEESHMQVAAEELIAGMYQPIKGRDRTASLDMVPKRIRIDSTDYTNLEGWGMHARPRFSLWKILAWIAFLAVLGLTFVVFWLVFIDETDLQNAFVPFTFLSTMIMIGLGVPQFLDVD